MVRLTMPKNRVFLLSALAMLLFAVLATPALAGAVADAIPSTYCGPAHPPSVDDVSVPQNPGPYIHLVYARASDQPDRFQQFADLMQRVAKDNIAAVEAASGQRKALHFDWDNSSGSTCLDISSAWLDKPLSYYTSVDPTTRIQRIMSRPFWHTIGYPNDVIVWADNFAAPGDPASSGQLPLDDQPGPGNAANNPDRTPRLGFLWGAGDPQTFFQAPGVGEDPDRQAALAQLRVILRLLGAAQSSAPHATAGATVSEAGDVLADDNPVASDCAANVIDCHGDDYFNPAPADGSYLATHWNVYNSPMLCNEVSCFKTPANTRSAPTASLPPAPVIVADGQAATLTVTASDPIGDGLHYAWKIERVQDPYWRHQGPDNVPVGGDSPTVTLPVEPNDTTTWLYVKVTDAWGRWTTAETQVETGDPRHTAGDPNAGKTITLGGGRVDAHADWPKPRVSWLRDSRKAILHQRGLRFRVANPRGPRKGLLYVAFTRPQQAKQLHLQRVLSKAIIGASPRPRTVLLHLGPGALRAIKAKKHLQVLVMLYVSGMLATQSFTIR